MLGFSKLYENLKLLFDVKVHIALFTNTLAKANGAEVNGQL